MLYKDKIIGIMKDHAAFATPDKMVPSPVNVAMLGMMKAVRGDYTEISKAAPVYIRKSEAEMKWTGKS